jgi:ectoine hydroxylase
VKLTSEQIAAFDRDGYLIFPSLLSADEVATLRSELARVSQIPDQRIMREKISNEPRIIYGMPDVGGPTYSPAYRALSRDPRVVQPIVDLLGEAVTLYHIKCNFKEAITGEFWQWHQDYANWKANDNAPEPRLLTSMVMLDKATEMNGCLYFVPGSHRLGLVKSAWDDSSTAYALWTVDKPSMIDITGRLGDPVAVTGEPGTVVIFHANTIHGSGHNMSPRSRWQVYLVYNAVSNVLGPVAKPRPDWQANRHTAPVEILTEPAIMTAALETA